MSHLGCRSRTECITHSFIPSSRKNALDPEMTLRKNHALNSWARVPTPKTPTPFCPMHLENKGPWGFSLSARHSLWLCLQKDYEDGRWGRCSLVSHPRLRPVLQRTPCKCYPMSNKRGFYLLKHLHCPVTTVWYLPLETCWSSPFPTY